MSIKTEKIRKLLKERKISNKELAYGIGISQQAVSHILNGRQNPTVEVLKKMADCLNVPIDYLLSDNESIDIITEKDLNILFKIIQETLSALKIPASDKITELIKIIFEDYKSNKLGEEDLQERIEKLSKLAV